MFFIVLTRLVNRKKKETDELQFPEFIFETCSDSAESQVNLKTD